MTLTIQRNGAIAVLDPIPWDFQTFRRRKASLPTQLRPVECGVLFKVQTPYTDAEHELFVSEVTALDRWYAENEPKLTGYARLCKVAERTGASHFQVQDALDEADRLAEAS